MTFDPAELILWYVVFLFSTTLHEAAHAWAALKGGDPTAYRGGQVSLDPVPHIRREPIGMVVLPVISLLLSGWPFGFASAPYDPVWAQRYPKRAALMALAGPMANLMLVLVSVLLIWVGMWAGRFEAPSSLSTGSLAMVTVSRDAGFWPVAAMGVSILFSLNMILAVLNLFPLPPLDGSGALTYFMGHEQAARYQEVTRRFSILGLIIVWKIFWPVFWPVFCSTVSLIYPDASYG